MKPLHTSAELHDLSFRFRVDGVPYTVNASVFVQCRHFDNRGNYGPPTEIFTEAELDGWHCDPEPPADHLPRLEQLLTEAIEEKDWV